MDKILSARVDEAVIKQIGLLALEMRLSKKAIIEAAISTYVEKLALQKKVDPFEQSFGGWQREESVEDTLAQVRAKMNSAKQSVFPASSNAPIKSKSPPE